MEAPGSPLLGQDAGVLAGLPAQRHQALRRPVALSANADGILDFTVPAATLANAAIAAERGSRTSSAPPACRRSDDAVIKSVDARAVVMKSGNMSLGVNLLAAMIKRVAQALDENSTSRFVEMHHNA